MKEKYDSYGGERIATGIPGLDEMLGGGLPRNRCYIIMGGPGAGKTILGLQFLYMGALENGDVGLYVSLDESPAHIRENTKSFNWTLEELEKAGLFTIVDASPIRAIPGDVKLGGITIGKRDFSLVSFLNVVRTEAQKVKAKRIVVDSLTILAYQFQEEPERRRALLDLFRAFTEMDATFIITSELRTSILERPVQPEEFLAHGAIVLYTMPDGNRAIHIEKMRGIQHDTKLRPYQINENGIEIFPQERVFKTQKTSRE